MKSQKKRVGQPAIEEWERWRVAAWAHEVQRQAQAKMAKMPLPSDDPFAYSAKAIKAKWGTPQRKTHISSGTVTPNDLDMVFVGDQKSSFYKYASGKRPRPRQKFIDAVDMVLPNTGFVFTVGPQGIPLWAVLAGKITVEDFWIPIVQSGQVTDALGLPLDQSERFDVEERRHYPKLATVEQGAVTSESFDAVLKHQARVILPIVPWQFLARTLAEYFAPCFFREHPEQPFGSEMIKAESVNVGVATLVVALGQLALNDSNAATNDKDILCQLLLGIIPFWQKVDDLYYSGVNSQFAQTVRVVVARLSFMDAASAAGLRT